MKVNPNFKKIAIRAAKEAGSVLMKNFKEIDSFSLKKDNSIVSNIDYSAEKMIVNLVKRNFPSHDIFSEEVGGKFSEGYSWIIDALDGTTNYISRVPVFSVSIALFCNKEPILAAIYNPVLKDLYFSEKEQGFFINGKKPRKRLRDSILVLSKGKGKNNIIKMAEILKRSVGSFRTFRVYGSSALDLCSVASGMVEGFVLPGADLWDVAAGVLMVRETGGSVIDFKGKEWSLKSKDLIASNSKKNSKKFLSFI